MVTKGIPKGDSIQEFGPLGLVRRGEGSAFEMEVLTSFLENITCSEKKFVLLEDIFRGDIWGNVWQLGVGESRGEESAKQCTMGPLQWEDGNRNFSFLRRNMTISRQNVTFTF